VKTFLLASTIWFAGCCAPAQSGDIAVDCIGVAAINANIIDTLTLTNVHVWCADSISAAIHEVSKPYEKPTKSGVYVYTLKIDTTYEAISQDLYRRVIDTLETWEPQRKHECFPNVLTVDTVLTW